jgi:hypothetical protein
MEKTIEVQMQELRESLAQDIEAYTCVDGCHECDFCKGLFQAANVVRGISIERIY